MRKTKITTALAALAVAAVALVGCTGAPEPEATPTSEVDATPPRAEPVATAESGCTSPAWINLTPVSAIVHGIVEDQGEREYAQGTVDLNEDGKITSYTVAPGDVPEVVGERLCIKNGGAIPHLNHTRTIHPGQVLRLNPDPSLPFINYFAPWDAPEGFEQIPYQKAIGEMGAASNAQDIETMRTIWTDTLSAMLTDQRVTDAVERALDAEDIDALQQLFS